jgi:hypothetical protein
MTTYTIKETVLYQINAKSAEKAEEKFLNSEDTKTFFVGVEEREVYEGKAEETYECVCCEKQHTNEFSLTCRVCDSERESGDLELPREYQD